MVAISIVQWRGLMIAMVMRSVRVWRHAVGRVGTIGGRRMGVRGVSGGRIGRRRRVLHSMRACWWLWWCWWLWRRWWL